MGGFWLYVVSILYKFQNIHTNNLTSQNIHGMKLKHYLVSNEILIKSLFCYFFQSHYIISHFFSLLYKYTRWRKKCQILFSYLSAHSSVSYTHTCLSTENSAIPYDKYYILISDIKVTEFSHNSILSVFLTKKNEDFLPSSQSVDMLQRRLIRGLTGAQFVWR